MVYLFQTNIKDSKKINVGLRKIYGIGKTFSKKITEQLGMSHRVKISRLSNAQLQYITRVISNSFNIGSQVKQERNENIRRLIRISCYRGFRHVNRLPVRGQRTRDNAQTCRKLKHY